MNSFICESLCGRQPAAAADGDKFASVREEDWSQARAVKGFVKQMDTKVSGGKIFSLRSDSQFNFDLCAQVVAVMPADICW